MMVFFQKHPSGGEGIWLPASETYTIYKELERLLYKHKAGFSPKRVTELTQNMYEIVCQIPNSIESKKIILKMDEQQQVLYNIIHE